MRAIAHRVTAILIVALLTAVVAVLGGCSNSSGPSASGYLEPTSPENVLLNLERAYRYRNLDEYLDCMSDDFKFHFSEADQYGWPQLPPWFYKSDEQQVHENMFGDEWGVESITLTLTVASVETIPGGDSGRPTGDVVVIRTGADLMVNLLGGVSYLASSDQEFRFRTVLDWDARNGRAHWEMFEWHDLDDYDTGSRREDAGWGGIKYCFLESLSETAHRTSPAEVIDQLEAAYVALDTLNYLDCLSQDFTFYPSPADLQDPHGNMPEEWYKLDERTMHENMFTGPDAVESILLTLTNITMEHHEGDPHDPLDDTYVFIEGVDLLVMLYGYQAYLATAPSEFRLRVDQDEEGPYGETMWEIDSWFDLDVTPRGDESGRREDSSWGGIKALFR
ncbi:hypothetical protein KAW64_08640 [bacterium]|nr:hypothetical protein [bacterium]